MSFRDNLQYLRATRNMTQEQLAMLVGVSRQSVTKWEAGRAYPEMDKLLKLCQLFECTMDDLVQGDLTSRAPLPAQISAPSGPPQDVCGYDEHARRIARQVPTGIACMLAGAAFGLPFLDAGAFFEGPGSPDHNQLRALAQSLADFAGDPSLFGAIGVGCVFAGIVAGLAFLVPAGMEHAAFVKAHPYLEDFYTAQQKADARRRFARQLVAGVSAMPLGAMAVICAGAFSEEAQRVAASPMLLFAAAGCWPIVHGCMMLGRTNIAEYNKNAAENLEIEDIANAQLDEARKEALLDAKRTDARIGAVCGAIMAAATIAGLLMLFVPALASGDPDGFEPEGTPTMFFWLTWVVGGLLCAVVGVLMKAFAGEAPLSAK